MKLSLVLLLVCLVPLVVQSKSLSQEKDSSSVQSEREILTKKESSLRSLDTKQEQEQRSLERKV